VLLFGGRSAEHEVSCVSAVGVLRALDPARYRVLPVGITHEGRWVVAEEARRVLAAGGDRAALPAALTAAGTEVEPLAALAGEPSRAGKASERGGPGEAGGTSEAGEPGEPGGTGEGPLVVLPLLHGPFGEDGTVQGLCELAGVPYVGSGVLGSAVCMDKVVTKRLLVEAGLPVARYLGLREWDVDDDLAGRVAGELGGFPVFVKPANLGSSVGVTKASDPGELEAAVATALSYDEWVVVEEAVAGREIECGVLGDRDPQASVPGEILPSHDYYDYEDKYVDGRAELLVPAPLPEEVAAEVRRLAVATFRAVRAEGMARVDFFYEEGGRGLLVNEVNTIPGFTPISMYPMLWAASGVPYPELLDRLIGLALERHARRAARVGRARPTSARPGR
jgi:D-alanine-D-alanine ligase